MNRDRPDPVIQQILQQAQGDPGVLQDHWKDQVFESLHYTLYVYPNSQSKKDVINKNPIIMFVDVDVLNT
jgi:hypothetical protein